MSAIVDKKKTPPPALAQKIIRKTEAATVHDASMGIGTASPWGAPQRKEERGGFESLFCFVLFCFCFCYFILYFFAYLFVYFCSMTKGR